MITSGAALSYARRNSAATAQPGTGAQVAQLVSLMRSESAVEYLGGLAMLNALSTALFTLTLRLASEANETPTGLLALDSNPRLSPALTAIFNEPARAKPAALRLPLGEALRGSILDAD